MMQSPWHAVLIAAAILLLPGLVFACTQEDVWFVEPLFGSPELRAPAEGPLLVRVGGGNSAVDLDPDELLFWVIDADEVKLPGTISITGSDRAKTVEWIPEVPLTDPTYRVEIRHPAGGGTMLITDLLVIDAPEELEAPIIRSVRAWEIREPLGEQQCCEAKECRADDCGVVPEPCNSCWYDDYEYPISMLLRFEVPVTFPSHWVDVRYYQVESDGAETPIDFPAAARFPEDSSGPFCVVVELHDVVGGLTSRETACTEEVDGATRGVDNSAAKAACLDTADDGGCNTASATPGTLLLFGGVLLGLGNRRAKNRSVGG